MPKFQIDMSAVSESIRVEPGRHAAVIGKVELVESADKKSHNLRWAFTIAEGEAAGTPLTMFTSLKPNALWRLKAVLRNLGMNVSGSLDFEVDEETGIVVDPSFVGLPCILVVEDDTYNGVLRSSVTDVLAGEASLPKASNKTPLTGGLKLR